MGVAEETASQLKAAAGACNLFLDANMFPTGQTGFHLNSASLLASWPHADSRAC